MAEVDELFTNGPQRVQTTTEAEFQRQFVTMIGSLPRFIASIGAGVLFAIVLAALNTMLMAGRERTADLGILKAKETPPIDVILVEVPDEVGGYGSKGVGEIGLVPTAGAVAGALHAYDGIRRFRLPMIDAPAAVAVPKSRRPAPDTTGD